MFKVLKQLGSILLLCTLLLSINSYAFADDYSDCVANITQQARNTCEAFEDESLTECNKKNTQAEIFACQEALQNQIEICISNFRTQNSGTCDALKEKPSDQTNTQKPHKSKEECLTNLKNDESNFAKCSGLEEKAAECYENSKDNVGTICNDRFKSSFTTCNNLATPALKSDCEKELFGYTDKCISDYESDPQNTAGCKAQEDTAKKCREDGNKAIDQICEELYPFDESIPDAPTTSTTTTTTTDSQIPTIPDIDTLVKPEVTDVSQVSPYLSSTFLPRVANTIVSFGIGAAVLGLILGSIGLLTAYGNDEKYGNAKKGIYFSLIGLIICLLAFAIVQLIFYTGYQAGQIR